MRIHQGPGRIPKGPPLALHPLAKLWSTYNPASFGPIESFKSHWWGLMLRGRVRECNLVHGSVMWALGSVMSYDRGPRECNSVHGECDLVPGRPSPEA